MESRLISLRLLLREMESFSSVLFISWEKKKGTHRLFFHVMVDHSLVHLNVFANENPFGRRNVDSKSVLSDGAPNEDSFLATCFQF
jgi:hypothetical protein